MADDAGIASRSTDPPPQLSGVHHTARPTWKLTETVHFYRDVLGLELVHAISAKGWGAADHPDFLHFFFASGRGSTIAFFYYLNTARPAPTVPPGEWLDTSAHTAWQVETREELNAWRARIEGQGLKVMQIAHEIIESLYVTDPNGYLVEISLQTRPMDAFDALDARLTLEAAMSLERDPGSRATKIDEIWQRKAQLVEASGAFV